MPKKLLSVLLSSTVFLYGLGCSRYNEKIGLNVNLEPSMPIAADVIGNQNSNSNSDLPKPAVDTADDSDSSPNPEPSKPVVDLANDKSSDAKPEPSKAVVDKKEEAKENKAEVVVEEAKPADKDANSKSNKPDEEKKPDPTPASVNPLNNNVIPIVAMIAIAGAAGAGIAAIAYAIYNRFFGGAGDAQPAQPANNNPQPANNDPANNDPQGEDNNPQADPKVNDDNKGKKDPPDDVNDEEEDDDDNMGDVPQGSGQGGVLKAKVSKRRKVSPQPTQTDPRPEPELTQTQTQHTQEEEVQNQPAPVQQPADPIRYNVVERAQLIVDMRQIELPRLVVQQHRGENLTPLQEAENRLFDLYFEVYDFQTLAVMADLQEFDINPRAPDPDQIEFYRERLGIAEEQMREVEARVIELRAQQQAVPQEEQEEQVPVAQHEADEDDQIILEAREAIIRYDNTMRRARQEREQARADGDQARVQRLDIFIMDIMRLFDTTESYLLGYDRDWYEQYRTSRIPDPLE